ncbi:hypothetical protein DEFR109230_02600 [Deinococcus frigens]
MSADFRFTYLWQGPPSKKWDISAPGMALQCLLCALWS